MEEDLRRMSSMNQPLLEAAATGCGSRNLRQQRRLEVLAHHLQAAPAREECASSSSSLAQCLSPRVFPLNLHAASNVCGGPVRISLVSQWLKSESRFVGQPLSSKEKGEPVVIGGIVLDIQASPFSHGIQPGTTTPGEVRYVRGGVGRNVAECLSRFGQHPFLISVVGDDTAGDTLLAHWQSLGLSLYGVRKCVGIATPVVSAVFDGRGELAAAVADTQAVEVYLTPDWIKGFASQIQSAPVVMLDANLHPLALEAACKLASDAGVPIWFEPVSIAKAARATDLLKSITFVSPNEAEIVAMAEALHSKNTKAGQPARRVALMEGSTIKSVSDILDQKLQRPIREVLQAGVRYIVLTLGSQGAVLCSKEPLGHILYHHYPALPASVVKLSGAGDCLVAGTLAALSRKVVEQRAVAYGVAAAKLAVESETNVPQTLSWEALSDSVNAVIDQVRTLVVFS